jgi:hypothetical protein
MGEILSNRKDESIRILNENVAQAICSLQQEVQAIKTQFQIYHNNLTNANDLLTSLFTQTRLAVNEMSGKHDKNSSSLKAITQQLSKLNLSVGHPIQQHIAVDSNETDVIVEPNLDNVDGTNVPDSKNVVSSLEDNQLPAPHILAARAARRMGMNATQLITHVPRQVELHSDFPETWVDLYHEWKEKGLAYFSGKHQWPSQAITRQYNKRKGAMAEIERAKKEQQMRAIKDNPQSQIKIKDLDVAVMLDTERCNRGYTCNLHYEMLAANNPSIKRRVCKPKTVTDI